ERRGSRTGERDNRSLRDKLCESRRWYSLHVAHHRLRSRADGYDRRNPRSRGRSSPDVESAPSLAVRANAAKACVRRRSDFVEVGAPAERGDQLSEAFVAPPHPRPLPAARAGGGEHERLLRTAIEKRSWLPASSI